MGVRARGTGERSGVWVAAVAASAVTVMLTGCQGGSPGAKAGSAPGASATSGASAPAADGSTSGGAARPGESATAYPVAASASPSALPALGARSGGRWALVLNGVRRSGGNAVVVTATVTNTSTDNAVFAGFEEPGFSVSKDADGKYLSTYEFSAVTLTVPGSATQYRAMRDEHGACACTQGIVNLDAGASRAVYAYVTAPPGATTVTVTVQGFAPFTGVTVQS